MRVEAILLPLVLVQVVRPHSWPGVPAWAVQSLRFRDEWALYLLRLVLLQAVETHLRRRWRQARTGFLGFLLFEPRLSRVESGFDDVDSFEVFNEVGLLLHFVAYIVLVEIVVANIVS